PQRAQGVPLRHKGCSLGCFAWDFSPCQKSRRASNHMNRFFGSSMTSRILGIVGALWLLCATLMPGTQAAPQAKGPQATRPQAARPQVARPRAAAPQAAPPQAASPEALPQTIAFNRDIRPILSDKCFKC